MNALRFTLLADGASDRVLLHPLRWLFIDNGVSLAIHAEYGDLRHLRKPPRRLCQRIAKCLELYPCDVLFVHRDAESQTWDERKTEILAAVEDLRDDHKAQLPVVCVIPVRMQEAWFLFDEKAIRKASGNPGGKTRLDLPHLAIVESLPNPKQFLFDLLLQASELPPRRRRKLRPEECFHRLGEILDDFSPLRSLAAFRELEQQVIAVIRSNEWPDPA